jgi:hypothetical protein
VACIGEERKVYKVLVGKPEGKRPLGRPRHRWGDGIRMDLKEIGLGGVNWIRLVAGCCESCDEPSGSCATELVLVSYWYVACYHPIVPIFCNVSRNYE